MTGWEWDETLYAGSALYYAAGRVPYTSSIVDAARIELGLDGTGRLLDVGCGPGSLTLMLAPLVAWAVGIDADADMVSVARNRALVAGVSNVAWRRLRAEELPAGLGPFRLVTFAQSFHWMDQPRVAELIRPMLTPDGAWVHVNTTTHPGLDADDPLEWPRPPWPAIEALITSYLGPVRRAGQGLLPQGTPGGEQDVMRAAGYRGPTLVEVGGADAVPRTANDIVAGVFSMSYAAPHLFGDRLAPFESDLRALLRDTAPDDRFAERTQEIALVIWRP